MRARCALLPEVRKSMPEADSGEQDYFQVV